MSHYTVPQINYKADTSVVVVKRPRCDAIRIGFSFIKSFPIDAGERLLAGRRSGKYHSLEQLVQQSNLSRSECETLIDVGALDCFGATRPELHWYLRLYQTDSPHTPRRCSDALLFEHEGDTGPTLPYLPDYSLEEKGELERSALGFNCAEHPISRFAIANERGIIDAANLESYVGEQVTLLGWLVTAKRTKTARGEYMKFLTLEDESDIFEATLFPLIYHRFGSLIDGRGPYLVTGLVENDNRHITVTVSSVATIT